MTHAEYGAQMAAANLGKLSKENQKAIQLSGKQAEKKGRILTTALSPHRVSVDVAACADVGCGGTMCTEGWCECARAVVPWRAGSAPLKGAALRQCQTQECGGDSRPPPPRRQPLSVQTGKSGRVFEHRVVCVA